MGTSFQKNSSGNTILSWLRAWPGSRVTIVVDEDGSIRDRRTVEEEGGGRHWRAEVAVMQAQSGRVAPETPAGGGAMGVLKRGQRRPERARGVSSFPTVNRLLVILSLAPYFFLKLVYSFDLPSLDGLMQALDDWRPRAQGWWWQGWQRS